VPGIVSEPSSPCAIGERPDAAQVLAMTGDEMRTHVSALVGFSEVLLSPSGADLRDPERFEHLKTIHECSIHLQALAVDVLDAARIETGRLQIHEQEVDAAELIEVAMKLCRETAETSGVSIMASVVDGIELRCDVNRIKQVVVKLISHALRHSPPGTAVQLDCDADTCGGLVIAVLSGHAEAALTTASVAPAMGAEQERPLSHRPGGRELALHVAQHVARLHGGDLFFSSNDGAAIVSRLVLPSHRVVWPSAATPQSSIAA
jgi:signal transduction histidine kinase